VPLTNVHCELVCGRRLEMALISSYCVAVLTIAFGLAMMGIGSRSGGGARIFSSAELRLAAERQAPLLLVVVGEVYDVTSGREYYARQPDQSADSDSYEGASTSGRTADRASEKIAVAIAAVMMLVAVPPAGLPGFANGTDASRAFLTADFVHNATDDLDDLSPGQCLGVEHWVGFYRDHATYAHVGRHHGRFFDASGTPTEAHAAFRACVARGNAVLERARQAVLAAPRCAEGTPSGNAKYNVGSWKRYACEAPLAPRRATVDSAAVCACLRPEAPAEGGFEPGTNGFDADDPALPAAYHGCDAAAAVCAVRTA